VTTGTSADTDAPGPRQWWQWFEPIHAVTYFAAESRQATEALGLRGFWMGYFAGRSAPLGTVGPGPVTALFFTFDPAMVARSLPDAWALTTPPEVSRARARGAAAALRRLVPEFDDLAADLVPLLRGPVERLDTVGRALGAATCGLPWPEDPVEALWHACTCLREHRGDGHVAALTAAGLDGCEALVLFAASTGIEESLFLASRGWSDPSWASARRRLEQRGLIGDGSLTGDGVALRASIESLTDQLAEAPWAALAAADGPAVADGLATLARKVHAAGLIPFPNPIGLPTPA
jgi:hypothetical protein